MAMRCASSRGDGLDGALGRLDGAEKLSCVRDVGQELEVVPHPFDELAGIEPTMNDSGLRQ